MAYPSAVLLRGWVRAWFASRRSSGTTGFAYLAREGESVSPAHAVTALT